KIGRYAGKSHEGVIAPHPAPGQAGRPWRAGRRRGSPFGAQPAEGVADAPGAARPGSLWRSGAPCPPGRPGGIGVVEARLTIFPEESHELTRKGKPRHRVENFKEILSWLDKHV
ncbi:MAG: hypothetical protein QW247_01530, partial [Pyrobaculum sp.]